MSSTSDPKALDFWEGALFLATFLLPTFALNGIWRWPVAPELQTAAFALMGYALAEILRPWALGWPVRRKCLVLCLELAAALALWALAWP